MSNEIVEPDNSIAIDAISSRLCKVANLVDNLDQIFKETQEDLGLSDAEISEVTDKRSHDVREMHAH